MNIEAYILSGKVEAYVLGIATPEEVSEIEQLMAQHPAILAAVQEQEDMLARYAEHHAVTPPPELRKNTWEAIAKDSLDESRPVFTTVAHEPHAAPHRHALSRRSYYALAASVAFLVVSVIGNIWMMGEQKKMKADMAVLESGQKTLMAEKNTAEASVRKANELLEVLSLPQLKKINLAGVGAHTAHSGMLYWDNATGNVFLDLNSMPAAPEGKQYQLWAIVDGKPVDAGMYDAAASSMLHKMKTIAKAEMFAITIENMGGSPVPTLDQMVVAGKT